MKTLDSKLPIDHDVTLFEEGEIGTCAYLIEAGSVEISMIRKGKKIVVAQRFAGEIIGEMAIIDRLPRTATAITLEPCTLFTITQEQIQSRLSQTDPVLRLCVNVLIHRFRETLDNIQSLRQPELTSTSGELLPFTKDASAKQNKLAIKQIKQEKALIFAAHNNEFELYYQPIIELDTDQLVGVEAFLRWNHPEKDLISASEFISDAENGNLTTQIGRWVFRQACTFINRIKSIFPNLIQNDQPFIFINVSARDFSDPLLVHSLIEISKEKKVSPSHIKLEINASALLSDKRIAIPNINSLKDFGFTISIDNFGSAGSNLEDLQKIPLDTVKIDQTFIQDSDRNIGNYSILASILELGKTMHFSVVAEGIETKAQAERLNEMHCPLGQGNYFAEPLPEEAIIRWIQDGMLPTKKEHPVLEQESPLAL